MVNRMLCVTGMLLALSTSIANAAIDQKSLLASQKVKGNNDYLLSYAIPDGFYNYFDFKFDSSNGANYNRYQGHSSQYGLGSNVVSFPMKLMAGLYVYHVDTSLDSQFFVTSSLPSQQHQSLSNDTLMVHVLRPLGMFVFDVAGAFGRTITSTNLVTTPLVGSPFVGSGRGTNNNWYVSLSSLFAYNWEKVKLRGDVRVLYSQVDSGNYPIYFTNTLTTLPLAGMTTKGTWVIENAELGYQVNSTITPFINGSLLQVPYYRTSRPLISTADIVGALPQLTLNNSGYKVGGGVVLSKNQFSVRLEEKYYRAGSVYRSYQTLVKFLYQAV